MIYLDFLFDKKSIPPKEILSKTVSKVNSAQNFCTDDGRALSNDSAVCRFFIQPNGLGGSGFILFNGKIATAGHVASSIGSGSVIEFNVPLSEEDGTRKRSSADDQYAVNVSSITSQTVHDNGLGDDWAVISVYANSNTGLMPKEAQGAYFYVEQNNAFQSVRVTGYGEDDGTYNKVEQTMSGLNDGSSGNVVKYKVYTQGDNSGSPVINEANGKVVGIHTNNNCSNGNNEGTSFLNSSLWNTVNPVFNLTVHQKRESGAELTNTYIYRWIGTQLSGSFQSYPVNSNGASIDNVIYGNYETFRSKQDLITTSPNEKYNKWKLNNNDNNDVTNHQSFFISSDLSSLTSQFKQTYSGITLKNAYPEVSGLDPSTDVIEFNDPWLIDYNDPDYNGTTYRNRGMATAPFKSRSAPFYPDYNSYYGSDQYLGVFLNEEYDPQGQNPYYQVRSPIQQPQDIYLSQTGKYHKFYFYNWSSSGTDALTQNNIVNGYYESAVVFRNGSAIVIANLKGTQISNGSGITNSNQRKIVRSDDGKLHLVYGSMGHVWYEISSNNGATWEIANSGKPLDSDGGNSPSIDYSPSEGSGNNIVVTFEANVNGLTYIETQFFQNGIYL